MIRVSWPWVIRQWINYCGETIDKVRIARLSACASKKTSSKASLFCFIPYNSTANNVRARLDGTKVSVDPGRYWSRISICRKQNTTHRIRRYLPCSFHRQATGRADVGLFRRKVNFNKIKEKIRMICGFAGGGLR